MKTPRQAFKENFWIGAKGGLLDKKHVDAMSYKGGTAVWLFLYLLRGQTGINEWGEGIFQYGHPLTIREIAADFGGVSVRTVQRWVIVLRKGGYISTDSHSSHGMTFWIAKAKDKTKKPRTVTGTHTASKTLAKGKTPYTDSVSSLENSIHQSRSEFQNSIRDAVIDSPQEIESAGIAVPIPKGSIPKSLFYYNTDAAAKTAADVSSLLKEAARELQPPTLMSHADLDARRRELLRQDEKLRREHPNWYKQPGKVTAIQREAAM